jgi:phosphatidylserine/phosphatidylglycerophosphate/cardiolipin synthase-like enzyme
MKKFLFSIGLSMTALIGFAQIDIDSARTLPIGTNVTISGIVTNGSELGPIRYVQDATGAIPCYPGSGSVPFSTSRGDSVTISGTLKDYNGLLEVDPISSVTVHSSNNTLPAPTIITIPQMGEPTEALLVQLDGVTFTNGGSTFTVGTHTFTDGMGNSSVIYVRNGHPLVGELIPLGPFTLVGLMAQFTFTGVGGYQILARDTNDLVFNSSILFSSGVQLSNQTTSSFDLSWMTNSNGSTNCRYGKTPGFELGEVNNGGSTNSHSLSLSGLDAGTIYYVQPYSENGTDTAWGNVGLYTTVSNSTGAMRVYFNYPVDNSVAQNVNAIYLNGTFNDTIKAYIDKAQSTLDIAVYNASDAMIMNAINDAHDRGVQVRYIAEGGNLNTGLDLLDNDIPVLEKPDAQPGIMHNKFVIVDAESVNNSWILSGATNWSFNQLFDDPNDIIFIQDQALARAYTLEFEEMWGSDGAQPNFSNAKFGNEKLDNTPHIFQIGGRLVESYFSPSDGTTNQIIQTMASTDQELNFAIMSFTRDDIAQAIMDVHSAFGKSASGIMENINDSGSEYQTLLSAGVPIYETQTIPDIMHHKFAIIDRHSTLDPIILTGSHNWSTSAETTNDENTLIIHDADIVDQYYQGFTALYNEAAGIGVEEFQSGSFHIYPNPAAELLRLESDLPDGMYIVEITDIAGRICSREEWNTNYAKILNVSAFQNGTYFVRVLGEGGATSLPFIVQH